jgi:RNA polymerase sigma factor FliA
MAIQTATPNPGANHVELSSLSSVEEIASPEIRNALVLEHLGDVRIVALGIARRLPRHVQLDDLIQAGTLGLIDAVTRFDRQRPVGIRQYIRIRITGAILDSLREQDWASRYMRSRQQKLQSVTNELEKNLGRTPESVELADAMGLDLQSFYEFAAAVEDLHRQGENETEDQSSSALYNLAQDPAQSPDSLFARAELQDQVHDAMGMLKAEHRRVLRMYYFEELTMSQIARELHLTESRISQIHARALVELQAQLQPGTKRIH